MPPLGRKLRKVRCGTQGSHLGALPPGKKISQAIQPSYTLTSADKGKKITVKVTGKALGYATKSQTSKATKKVS